MARAERQRVVQINAARARLNKQRELDEQLGRGFVHYSARAGEPERRLAGPAKAGAAKAGAAKAAGAAPSRGRKQPAAAAARQQPHAPQRRTQG
eukprot:scaffold45165_cov66-Phaeocystis_antarctica.AAC.2